MRSHINTPQGTVKVGDTIRINRMEDNAPSFTFTEGKDKQAAQYNGITGTVTCIDDAGQIHGTWGGLALIPEIDSFSIVCRSKKEANVQHPLQT